MKRFISFVLCFALCLSCLCGMSFAESENYVEISLNINDWWPEDARGGAERKAAAEAFLSGKKFASLAEAQAAFESLFSHTGGTYSDSSYTNVGPFYFYASDHTTNELTALSSVTFTVHGTVPFGTTGDLTLGVPSQFTFSDVVLRGSDHQGGSITDAKGLTAYVAGGYDESFSSRGEFLISGIDFVGGSYSFAVYGVSMSTGSTMRAEAAELTISGCSFDSGIYMYMNDPHVEERIITIDGNTITGAASGVGSTNYAIAIQHEDSPVDTTTGKTTIIGNTIENCRRGMNIQHRKTADVEIKYNTITDITDTVGIQLTSCEDALIEGNTIKNTTNSEHNYIRIHEKATELKSLLIKENTVGGVGHLIWDETEAATNKVTFSGNDIEPTVNIEQYWDKDAGASVTSAASNGNRSFAGDLLKVTVLFSEGPSSVTEITIPRGSTVSRPADPTPPSSDREFAGWVVFRDGRMVEFDFSTPINENTTIHAAWKPVQAAPTPAPTPAPEARPNPSTGVGFFAWLMDILF